MNRAALALAALVVVGGCAKDRVSLLDNEDGAADFAIADISKPDQERVIDRPLAELKLGSRAPGKVRAKPRESDLQLANSLPLKAYRQDFFFDSGDFVLSPAQLAVLGRIKEAAFARAPATIEIEGFTDRDGDPDYNLGVSSNRAQAVAQQLRAAGFEIADENIVARGEYEAEKQGDADGSMNPSFRKVTVIVR